MRVAGPPQVDASEYGYGFGEAAVEVEKKEQRAVQASDNP